MRALARVNAQPTSVFSGARVALQGEDGCVWRGCASGTARCCCVLTTGVSTRVCVCVRVRAPAGQERACTCSRVRCGVRMRAHPQFKSRYGCCRAHPVRGYIRGALRTRTDRALRLRTGAAYRNA